MKKVISWMVLAAMAAGCGSGGNPEDAQPNLASIQENIFDSTCATSGCHDSASSEGDLDLSSADKSYASLVSVEAVDEDAAGLLRVEPGNAADSVLVMRISGTDLGARMPQGNAVLPEKAIAAITKWINDGAKK